jgi:hypothetical protein
LAAFLYRCPFTGQHVQGWTANGDDDQNTFRTVECLACARAHFVNAKTGKVLGAPDDGI